jgi:hypothetical protein
MFRSFFAYSVLLIAAYLTSCNKKDEPAPDRVTLLATHQWKIKACLYRMQGDASNLDFTSVVYQPCELDDIYYFGSDSSFERNESALVCSIGSFFGPWGTGTWSANSDLSQMKIQTFYYSVLFTVRILTGERLVLEQATKDSFGNDVIYTYEFVPV